MMPSSPNSRQSILRRSRRSVQRRRALAELEQRFEPTLAIVTEALQRLHDRYDRLKADQRHHDTLQQQIQTIQANHATPGLPELHTELAQLQAQLAELEVTLESQLFSWDGFQDVFWMAIRFGGLGILIGWFLRGFAT